MSTQTTFDKLSDILIEQLGLEPVDISVDSGIVEDLGANCYLPT